MPNAFGRRRPNRHSNAVTVNCCGSYQKPRTKCKDCGHVVGANRKAFYKLRPWSKPV